MGLCTVCDCLRVVICMLLVKVNILKSIVRRTNQMDTCRDGTRCLGIDRLYESFCVIFIEITILMY